MGQKLKDGVHVIRSWKADHACPDKAPGSTNLASAYEALQLIWGKVDPRRICKSGFGPLNLVVPLTDSGSCNPDGLLVL
jgi:hypothetical protein